MFLEISEESSSSETLKEDYCVNTIGADLRIRSSFISNCEKLITESTSPDLCNEHFLLKTQSLSKEIKVLSSAIYDLCSSKLNFISTNRGEIDDKNDENLISRDSANNKKFTDDELRYLTTQGPFQPKIQYNYLEYSKIKDAAFCFCCRLFGQGPGDARAEEAWTTKGVDSWSKMKGRGTQKARKLVTHFKSAAHKAAEKRLQIFSNKKSNVDLMLNADRREADQKREQLLKINEKIIISLLEVARFLGRQSLAFQGQEHDEGNFVEAVNLLRRRDPVMNKWFNDPSLRPYHVSYLTNRAQNEFIEILGKSVHQSILNDTYNSTFISVTIDSTLDKSHKEIYTIITRFEQNFEPKERVIAVAELPSKVGQDICDFVLNQLSLCGISTDKIIAQSYDNASNMSGKNTGVQECLNQALNRKIPYIPCSTHTRNLVVQHGSSISIEFVNFFKILQELFNFFNMSIKRHALLSLLLKDLSKTRWSDRYNSIKAVYSSYTEIIESLDDVTENEMIIKVNIELKDYLKVLNEKLNEDDDKQIKSIEPGIDDEDLLFAEVNAAQSKISEYENVTQACKLIKNLNHYPRLQRVYKYLITIPVSIASNERSFSKLKIIKNYLRSTKTNERLFYLMLCAIEKDKLDELNLHQSAKEWAKMKDRRIDL
ncbi:unnamed protein product [Didymodactylos carnosus]|uniref:TTF-type domain-containing protein n=1 Tax=Didymodactylos carnosus TaxID=1234261 RepID=A0A814UGL4_9BILA|nr:unnamed protein product [Didymodactylos carnosus]CAF3937256.1 unnamed protein product [Didymodactylos carnosus]